MGGGHGWSLGLPDYLTVAAAPFIKGKAKSKVMLQLMHSMCKSYSKTVVYFIHAPSVLRKKAN